MSSSPARSVCPVRVAVRKFDPFERAIRCQWSDFTRTAALDATLELEPLELNALHTRLIARGGLADGSVDSAFLPTDWLAEAQAAGLIESLSPYLAAAPIDDFPDDWRASLRRWQGWLAIGVRSSTWSDPEINRWIPFFHQLEVLHACARDERAARDDDAVFHGSRSHGEVA